MSKPALNDLISKSQHFKALKDYLKEAYGITATLDVNSPMLAHVNNCVALSREGPGEQEQAQRIGVELSRCAFSVLLHHGKAVFGHVRFDSDDQQGFAREVDGIMSQFLASSIGMQVIHAPDDAPCVIQIKVGDAQPAVMLLAPGEGLSLDVAERPLGDAFGASEAEEEAADAEEHDADEWAHDEGDESGHARSLYSALEGAEAMPGEEEPEEPPRPSAPPQRPPAAAKPPQPPPAGAGQRRTALDLLLSGEEPPPPPGAKPERSSEPLRGVDFHIASTHPSTQQAPTRGVDFHSQQGDAPWPPKQ